MEEKLAQENVEKGFNSILPGENWNNFPYYPWKMTEWNWLRAMMAPQNVFDHCTLTRKRRKLKLGDF